MTEIAAISAFISSIKNATDIARVIKDAGVSLEKAEVKFKVAELIESLAEAKIQASEVKELLQEKDQKIAELEKAFSLKSKLFRDGDAYYETIEDGRPVGAPYCSYCWEANHRAIHLTQIMGSLGDWYCPACKNTYNRKRVHILPES